MANTDATPIRRQYLEIKRQHRDAIVFFRLGDFYETFDEDAQIAARELDVVLTSRNVAKGQRVPMAGVPYHAAEGYIARLIARGYKVAVCEQQGEQDSGGLMAREVVRIVTPGTVVEPGLLADKRNNYLAAAVFSPHGVGLAHADITTGEFATTQIAPGSQRGAAEAVSAALRELERLNPAELVLSDGGEPHTAQGAPPPEEVARRYPALAGYEAAVALFDEWRFEAGTARQALLGHFRVSTLAGYGCEDQPLAARAAGVLLQYLQAHQPTALAQLTRLATYSVEAFMALDAPTRRCLELTETMRGRAAEGSLLDVLDQTLTPMGGRLLRRWLGQPLLDRGAIEERLTAVDVAFRSAHRRTALRAALKGYADLERLTNRVVQGVALPRELLALRAALDRTGEVRALVGHLVAESDLPEAGTVYPLDGQGLAPAEEVVEAIGAAIVDEPPATLAAGGVIRRGYSSELDAIEDSVAESKRWVARLEKVERQRTGLKSLKVGYNKVFGYYLEVTKANGEMVPDDYIRKQTLVNSERYITPELKDHEALILNAADRTQELETALYRALLGDLAGHASALLATARAVAHLDVYLSLAEHAAACGYVRPELADDDRLEIVGGRHPVVERLLPSGALFVPNDVRLSGEEAVHIITGPNMSGKSTFLRQVALITLLAQVGSFVPAESARVGLVDRIFARVGAQDQISAGQSTFMVEMVEMANILNHATGRSLLILDEVGRGTSTYDGISIAWSVVEFLHNHPRLQCRTLFATHYHELTELEALLPRVRNYNVAVAQSGEEIVFTHHIVPGGADRSYGIHVAQMAGLPRAVVHRAEEILTELESGDERLPTPRRIREPQQLYLFGGVHPVIEELRNLDVMSMSPIEAINKLYELQQRSE
ncbi:MAG: DNA mismatch repair protein MutS [Chloroflexi bacterium]|nr:DNA mismatch repair protein MutS [Chloroflexota bacterium]